ncbi:Uncharacterized protein dnm_096760 [Desulfonema magnum]|uniref:Uncharacterized protein n=1 Tax=Desulfonema magnum TaxID=45655 RepID=A0A975BYJ7_9BACT|nr:Uncharacterized protein dnm_096760 [Desulfonema magnum]
MFIDNASSPWYVVIKKSTGQAGDGFRFSGMSPGPMRIGI